MLESQFQTKLIRELRFLFPASIVLKNDPDYIQGIPDLLILNGDRWAALECKRSEKEHRQPNQEHYVRTMDEMSFARFVFPENKDYILNELQQTFKS